MRESEMKSEEQTKRKSNVVRDKNNNNEKSEKIVSNKGISQN